MAGKKGCSGRKPKWYHEKYKRLEELAVIRAIETLEDDTDSYSDKQKDRVMQEVINKGLPQTIKHMTEDEDGKPKGLSVVVYLPKVKSE